MENKDLNSVDALLTDVIARRLSRREVLRRATALGLSIPAIGALLAACGGDDDDDDDDDDGGDDEPTATSADAGEGDATATEGGDDEATATTGDGGGGGGEATGKITIALSVEPDTLENWKAYSTDGHPVLRNVQEALLNRDPATNELVGELATAWEQVDDRTWRFTLREGVTFHNGDPFNAEVAAFGINYTWDPENDFEIYQFVGPDMTATAVDEYTVDVETVDPDPILPARLYFSPIPNMIQVQERPDSLPSEPIGTGPYSFVEWNRGQYIRLTANPDWWGHTADDSYGAVTVQDVEFVFRSESSVRAAMVETGEAQIGRFLAPEDCETTPQCIESASIESIFLRLDTNHPAMSDIRVRQAMALAIDKEGVASEFFGGGTPASQLVGPSATGYNPDLEPYPFDLDMATQLIEEAAADGVDVTAPIKVVTRRGIYLRNDELAEYLAAQFIEIGLDASSEVIDPAQYNPEYSTNLADVAPERGWVTTNPHGNEIMDVSATASSYYRCDGGASTYCNPELDAAYDAALPLVGDERAEAFAEVTKMYYDDYAAIPIIHMPLFYGLAENLTWTPRLDAFMLIKEMTLA